MARKLNTIKHILNYNEELGLPDIIVLDRMLVTLDLPKEYQFPELFIHHEI